MLYVIKRQSPKAEEKKFPFRDHKQIYAYTHTKHILGGGRRSKINSFEHTI